MGRGGRSRSGYPYFPRISLVGAVPPEAPPSPLWWTGRPVASAGGGGRNPPTASCGPACQPAVVTSSLLYMPGGRGWWLLNTCSRSAHGELDHHRTYLSPRWAQKRESSTNHLRSTSLTGCRSYVVGMENLQAHRSSLLVTARWWIAQEEMLWS